MPITHDQLLAFRAAYGPGSYVTVFPDSMRVGWKPLSWSRYTEVTTLPYPPHIIEELVFREVILDRELLSKIDTLKAGVISTIAGQALELSGPRDIDSTNRALADVRTTISGSIMEEIGLLICRAFPSYTPDDIDAMQWPTLLKRLVQAETVLIQTGQLKQRLELGSIQDKGRKKKKPPPRLPYLGEIPQANQRVSQQPAVVGRQPEPVPTRIKQDNPSPETIRATENIDWKKETREIESALRMNIHEREEMAIEREKLRQQLQDIYPNGLPKIK